jgi:hypothetical protein
MAGGIRIETTQSVAREVRAGLPSDLALAEIDREIRQVHASRMSSIW